MPREKSYMYPTVLVFKTSNRSNAKTKIKVYKTKNVDEVIDDLKEINCLEFLLKQKYYIYR